MAFDDDFAATFAVHLLEVLGEAEKVIQRPRGLDVDDAEIDAVILLDDVPPDRRQEGSKSVIERSGTMHVATSVTVTVATDLGRDLYFIRGEWWEAWTVGSGQFGLQAVEIRRTESISNRGGSG